MESVFSCNWRGGFLPTDRRYAHLSMPPTINSETGNHKRAKWDCELTRQGSRCFPARQIPSRASSQLVINVAIGRKVQCGYSAPAPSGRGRPSGRVATQPSALAAAGKPVFEIYAGERDRHRTIFCVACSFKIPQHFRDFVSPSDCRHAMPGFYRPAKQLLRMAPPLATNLSTAPTGIPKS